MRGCVGLRALHVDTCAGISDDALKRVGARCKDLRAFQAISIRDPRSEIRDPRYEILDQNFRVEAARTADGARKVRYEIRDPRS